MSCHCGGALIGDTEVKYHGHPGPQGSARYTTTMFWIGTNRLGQTAIPRVLISSRPVDGLTFRNNASEKRGYLNLSRRAPGVNETKKTIKGRGPKNRLAQAANGPERCLENIRKIRHRDRRMLGEYQKKIRQLNHS